MIGCGWRAKLTHSTLEVRPFSLGDFSIDKSTSEDINHCHHCLLHNYFVLFFCVCHNTGIHAFTSDESDLKKKHILGHRLLTCRQSAQEMLWQLFKHSQGNVQYQQLKLGTVVLIDRLHFWDRLAKPQ